MICDQDASCQYNYICSQNICVHKELFPPSIIDVISYFLLPILVGIGNVGGLGGGIIKVPLLMIMLNYQQRKATFLSYCILFGGCIANSFLILKKKHPIKVKPLIDYNIIMIINPLVILGTNIGVMLNVILPDLINGGLFIMFLCVVAPYLFNKGMKLYKQKQQSTLLNETNVSNKSINTIQENESEQERDRANSYMVGEQTDKKPIQASQIQNDQVNELKLFYINEEKQYPLHKLGILIFVFVTIQLLIFMRGGKGVQSILGIQNCSSAYWILSFAILIYSLLISYFIKIFITRQELHRKYIIEKYNLQSEFQNEFDLSDNKKYLVISGSGLLAGCISGTFGSGAALLLVPVFITYEIIPVVSSAVCGFNYFFIACASIISVITDNYLTLYEILLFSVLAFLGGFFCARLLYNIVEKKKAQHIVVFIVVGMAVLNIIGNVIYLIKKNYDQGFESLIDVGNFCSH